MAGEPHVPTGSDVASLLGELAGEAFEKTGGDVYRSGQPLVGDKTVEHAAETKSEEKPAEKVTEPTSESLIAGKWKTPAEAEKGVHELIHMAKSAMQERDAFKTKVDAMTAALSAISGGGTPQNGDSAPKDPMSEALSELESIAIPSEPIAKAIQIGVQREIQNMLKPVAERQRADQEIVKLYPDYEKEFDGVLEFLEKNADIKKEVEYAEAQGQYLLARKYAWLNFDRQARAPRQQGETEKKAQKREERVRETLPDAGVGVAGQRSEGRAPAPTADWPTEERMGYLKDMAKAGHPDILWRETIGRILTNQGFPSIDRGT